MVTIDHALNNGDIVEIVTSANSSGPSQDWLKIAKSPTARTKIRQFLRRENKSDDVARGKDALDRYLKKKGYDPQQLTRAGLLSKALKESGISSADDLYAQLSKGGTSINKFASILIGLEESEKQAEQKKAEEKEKTLLSGEHKKESKGSKKAQRHRRDNPGIIVKGANNLMIRIARCCNPVPGDEIVGFITKGRGISVHRKDCPNIASVPEVELARFIEVEWEAVKADKSYDAAVTIISKDRKGLFSDISRVCEDMDVHISAVNGRSGRDERAHITLTLSIDSTQQIQRVLRALRNVEGVEHVYRGNS